LDFVVGQSGFPMVLRVNCWVSEWVQENTLINSTTHIPFESNTV
jgi:hypothetical protein